MPEFLIQYLRDETERISFLYGPKIMTYLYNYFLVIHHTKVNFLFMIQLEKSALSHLFREVLRHMRAVPVFCYRSF